MINLLNKTTLSTLKSATLQVKQLLSLGPLQVSQLKWHNVQTYSELNSPYPALHGQEPLVEI